jgi:hypothetical protein
MVRHGYHSVPGRLARDAPRWFHHGEAEWIRAAPIQGPQVKPPKLKHSVAT